MCSTISISVSGRDGAWWLCVDWGWNMDPNSSHRSVNALASWFFEGLLKCSDILLFLQKKILRHPPALDKPPESSVFEARVSQALSMLQAGRLFESEAIYRELLADGRNSAGLANNLASILLVTNRHQEALPLLESALSINPDFPEAHLNMGVFCQVEHRLGAAMDSFRRAIRLRPDYKEAWYNLARLLHCQGRLRYSVNAYKRALAIDPSYLQASVSLSLALLSLGEFEQGWRFYHGRERLPEIQALFGLCDQGLRVYGLSFDRDNPILLIAEQGLGDTIQFIRYALYLKSVGFRVVIKAQSALHALLAFQGLALLVDSHGLPEAGLPWRAGQMMWKPLMSLPGELSVSPLNPVVSAPYIKADIGKCRYWSSILAAEGSPVVAINWQGNPGAEVHNLAGRSLALDCFFPISCVHGIKLLSLQKGVGSAQLQSCAFIDSFVSCQALVDDCWDFLEVAAIIESCDIVITSDTVTAHLAGALGKTTWLLLHRVPDWRWGIEGETSFWYPSMRLFRQEVAGNWGGVMQQVAAALSEFVASN